mmetsp:Transcript_47743/g.108261  ORF Transcript_47743/g.108261 Transcript_47743/m.108261 type:complete len:203 (-) Transcript_47743:123-731(-)
MYSTRHLMNHVRPPSIEHGREPEINHFCNTPIPIRAGKHHIFWLHVSVHDAHAVAVRGGHQCVPNDLRYEGLKQNLVGLPDQLFAIAPREGFQNQIQLLVLPIQTEFIEAHDMRMIQPLKGLNLKEAGGDLRRFQLRCINRLANPNILGGLVLDPHHRPEGPLPHHLQHVIYQLPIRLMPSSFASNQGPLVQAIRGNTLNGD